MKNQNELQKLEIIRLFDVLQRDIEILINLIYSCIDSKEQIKEMYKNSILNNFKNEKGVTEQNILDIYDLIYSHNIDIENKFNILERESDRIRRMYQVPIYSNTIENIKTLDLVLDNLFLLHNEIISKTIAELDVRTEIYHKNVMDDYSREFKLKTIQLIKFLDTVIPKYLISTLFIISQIVHNKNQTINDYKNNILNPQK